MLQGTSRCVEPYEEKRKTPVCSAVTDKKNVAKAALARTLNCQSAVGVLSRAARPPRPIPLQCIAMGLVFSFWLLRTVTGFMRPRPILRGVGTMVEKLRLSLASVEDARPNGLRQVHWHIPRALLLH